MKITYPKSLNPYRRTPPQGVALFRDEGTKEVKDIALAMVLNRHLNNQKLPH